MRKWIAIILATVMLLGLAACGGKAEEKNVDMKALYDQFGDKLPEMYLMDEETMLNYLGISMEDCAQAVVAVTSDGLGADEVWLIQAKDTEALARLQQLAQSRLAAKEDETVQYAPDQYAVVTAAKLLTEGNYLALLVSPEAEAMESLFESAVK